MSNQALEVIWELMQEEIAGVKQRLTNIEQKPDKVDFPNVAGADLPSAGVKGRTRYLVDGLADYGTIPLAIVDDGSSWKPIQNFELISHSVATLPVTLPNGTIRFATDGRKSGETAGNGTGQVVYWNNDTSEWLVMRDDTVVVD